MDHILNLRDLGHLLDEQPELSAVKNELDCLFSGTVGPTREQSLIFLSSRMLSSMKGGNYLQVVTTSQRILLPLENPEHFMYQIVHVVEGNVIPLVVVLMEEMTYESFRSILLRLSQITRHFRPRIVIAGSSSEGAAWPEVYGSLVRRQYVQFVQEMLTLVQLSCSSVARRKEARSLLRCFLAIPPLPPSLMKRGFCVLLKQAMKHGQLHKMQLFVLDFFKKFISGDKDETVFMYHLDNSRNNAREVANEMFFLELGSDCPSICELLDALIRYEWAAYESFWSVEQGAEISSCQKVATLKKDAVIRDATEDLLSGKNSIKCFLRLTSTQVLHVFKDSLRL